MNTRLQDIPATAENLRAALGSENLGLANTLILFTRTQSRNNLAQVLNGINEHINPYGNFQYITSHPDADELTNANSGIDGPGPLNVVVVGSLVDEMRKKLRDFTVTS